MLSSRGISQSYAGHHHPRDASRYHKIPSSSSSISIQSKSWQFLWRTLEPNKGEKCNVCNFYKPRFLTSKKKLLILTPQLSLEHESWSFQECKVDRLLVLLQSCKLFQATQDHSSRSVKTQRMKDNFTAIEHASLFFRRTHQNHLKTQN